MPVSRLVGLAARFGAADKTLLKQERLHHVNKSIHFFIERGGKRFHTHGAAMVNANDGGEEVSVKIIQALIVLFVAAPPLVREIFHLRGRGANEGGQLLAKGWNS